MRKNVWQGSASRWVIAFAVMALIGGAAQADFVVTYFGIGTGDDSDLAASATFELVGSALTVTLSNTSTFDTLAPADLLSGVYWDIADAGVSLTPVSATLASGSVIHLSAASDPGNWDGSNLGGEYGYNGAISGTDFNGADHGVSANGLGYFGEGELFDTSASANIDDPEAPNGMNFGIVSDGDDSGTGNSAVTGDRVLVDGSVAYAFTVSGTFDGFDLGNIWFQYGTDVTNPGYGGFCIVCPPPFDPPGDPVAEPATLGLLGLGLAGVLARARRKRS